MRPTGSPESGNGRIEEYDFALGFVEEFAGGYVSTEYRDAFGFLLIILVLVLKPQGLVPAKERIG